MVKEGTLSIDKSVTVGNAFDHYKYFTNVLWSTEEDAQKRRIVVVKGTYDLDKLAGTEFLGSRVTAVNIAETKRKLPGFEFAFVARFFISVDRNSFELAYKGLAISGDEKKGELPVSDLEDKDGAELTAVYFNQPSPSLVALVATTGPQ